MALTVLVAVAVLFFIFFFSLYARKFFSGVHDDGGGRQAPPPSNNWRVSYYYYYPPVGRTLGLDPSVVRTLPVLAYGSSVGGVKEGCVVCLVDFEEMEKVKRIPGCGHVFHPGCIDGWLLLHGSCPICRCSEWGRVDLASTRTHQEEQQVVVVEEEEVMNNIGEVERGREGGA